jgi:glyoxylase-like metal-dependent hydrolase (beta-lactamase superfamily II)
MPFELVTTNGIFAIDGNEWEVTNNIWIVGNDREVAIIDAAHDAEAILDAVHGRRVKAILLTHGHNDHVNAAIAVQDVVDAPIYLHPADDLLFDAVYPGMLPDKALVEGDKFLVGGEQLRVVHTPGHSPGCCCFATTGRVFSGDTLFCGGPGATATSTGNFTDIIESIRTKLFILPPHTIVHTGHGESTTIGAELPQLEEWIARGS